MATLNRYAIPTPPDADGESVTLCELCVDDHADAEHLEHLESVPSWHGCDGATDDGCPYEEEEEEEE